MHKTLRKVVQYRTHRKPKLYCRHCPAMSDSEERMFLDDRYEQPTVRSNGRKEEVSNADFFHF